MNANLASQHLKQNGDAVMVCHSVEDAGTIQKYACQHPHLVTRGKSAADIHFDMALCVLARLQRGDDLLGYDRRLVAVADKVGDADGGLDRAPALRCDVYRYEEIAREKRPCDEVGLARMLPALQVARQVNL